MKLMIYKLTLKPDMVEQHKHWDQMVKYLQK